MENLIILDFSTSTVHIYNVDSDSDINEEYIKNLGFNLNTCSFMFSSEIEIIKHKGILK